MLTLRMGILYFVLLLILLIVFHGMATVLIPNTRPENLYLIDWLLFMFVLCYVSAQRLRDLNKNPWKSLYLFIPFYNIYLLGEFFLRERMSPSEGIETKEGQSKHTIVK